MSGIGAAATALAATLPAAAPAAAGGALAAPSAASISGAATASFIDTLKAAVNSVDSQVATANGDAQAFASGSQDVSLSDVMVSLEKANLAFQAAATVRDKVTDAYTTVMNMQV